VRHEKNAWQTIFCRACFFRALWKSRKVKLLFAVYPKNVHGKVLGAQQRENFP
jgi:hypothetical protein